MDKITSVCRLCLKVIEENAPCIPLKNNSSVLQNLNLISYATIKNLQLTKNPVICEECNVKLLDLGKFKENIISNEFKIQCSQKDNENFFLKSLSDDINKICRLCLQISSNSIDSKNKWKERKILIDDCNIHLNMDIDHPSRICSKCDIFLQDLANFIMVCTQNEKTIVKLATKKGVLTSKDLLDNAKLNNSDVESCDAHNNAQSSKSEADNNNILRRHKGLTIRSRGRPRTNLKKENLTKDATITNNIESSSKNMANNSKCILQNNKGKGVENVEIFVFKAGSSKTYKRTNTDKKSHAYAQIKNEFKICNVESKEEKNTVNIDVGDSNIADVTLECLEDYDPADNGVQELTDLLDASELNITVEDEMLVGNEKTSTEDFIVMKIIQVQSDNDGDKQKATIEFEFNLSEDNDGDSQKKIVKLIQTKPNTTEEINEIQSETTPKEPIILNQQMIKQQRKLQLKVKPSKIKDGSSETKSPKTLKLISKDEGIKKYFKVSNSKKNLNENVAIISPQSKDSLGEESDKKSTLKTIEQKIKRKYENLKVKKGKNIVTCLSQINSQNQTDTVESTDAKVLSEPPQKRSKYSLKETNDDEIIEQVEECAVSDVATPEDVILENTHSSSSEKATISKKNTLEDAKKAKKSAAAEKPFDVTIIRRNKRIANKAELDKTWQKLTGKTVEKMQVDEKELKVEPTTSPKKRGRKPKPGKVQSAKSGHLQCSCCPFKTYSQNSFIQHQYIHGVMDTVAQHKCTQCPYMATSQDLLTQHQITHMSTNLNYKCIFCDYTSKKKISIMNHILRHDDKDVANMFYCVVLGEDNMDEYFECFQCDYQSTEEAVMPDHVIDHNRTVKIKNPMVAMVSCNLCSYRTKSEEMFQRHRALKHAGSEQEEPAQIKQGDGDTLYKCELCSFMTLKKRSLSNHKSMKHFSRKPAEKKETGERYYCAECPYTTPRKIYLARHATVHKTKENMEFFECPHCYFETKHRRSYTRHMEVRHQVIV